jgi:hypothetical protein
MSDMTGTDIEFDITDIPQTQAVPAINDFLLPKLTDAHRITLIVS